VPDLSHLPPFGWRQAHHGDALARFPYDSNLSGYGKDNVEDGRVARVRAMVGATEVEGVVESVAGWVEEAA
jgi:hypothetical protein